MFSDRFKWAASNAFWFSFWSMILLMISIVVSLTLYTKTESANAAFVSQISGILIIAMLWTRGRQFYHVYDIQVVESRIRGIKFRIGHRDAFKALWRKNGIVIPDGVTMIPEIGVTSWMSSEEDGKEYVHMTASGGFVAEVGAKYFDYAHVFGNNIMVVVEDERDLNMVNVVLHEEWAPYGLVAQCRSYSVRLLFDGSVLYPTQST
jgi:hypothetical protein